MKIKKMELEKMIEQFRSLEDQLSTVRSQISEYSDGFLYLTCLRCYGSLQWETHTNEFLVQELCNEFYGDNGIVDVYTNNSNHKISSYGDIKVMDLEEMKEISQNNISMSRAITSWITESFKTSPSISLPLWNAES